MVEKSHTAGWLPNLYEPFRLAGEKLADWFAPKSEASASNDQYEISIELPGVQIDDIHITADDNGLTVCGQKHVHRERTGRTYYFTEREYGSFQRTFRLPADADTDGINANLDHGVLTITVPKRAEEAPEQRKIAINQR